MTAAVLEPVFPGLTDRQIAGLELLRQEVPENLIGKLPKVTCRDCSKNSCNSHRKAECQVCKAWISTQHIHLDFVGHAETTSQFLEADLLWNWEPMGFTAEGLPALDDIGGLWIRLTICGVTRIGYGTADANGFKSTGDVRKELIGDALRNAGMRFGHALNLWAKTDIHSQQEQEPETPQRPEIPPFVSKDDARNLSILMKQKFGPLTDDQRHAQISGFIRRQIWSASQVFAHEAAAMLKSLSGLKDFVPPADRPSGNDLEQELRSMVRDARTLEQLDEAWVAVQNSAHTGAITHEQSQVLADVVNARESELKQPVGASA